MITHVDFGGLPPMRKDTPAPSGAMERGVHTLAKHKLALTMNTQGGWHVLRDGDIISVEGVRSFYSAALATLFIGVFGYMTPQGLIRPPDITALLEAS